ncbi:MAG: hypothetical protein R3309_11595, partial [Reinekea sp.]|nr:hypothetical protein [Reinekea sp.]
QQIAVEDAGLAIGQRVSHAMFGEGVIVNAEGGGAQTRVMVAFDDGKERTLMLQYANLQGL